LGPLAEQELFGEPEGFLYPFASATPVGDHDGVGWLFLGELFELFTTGGSIILEVLFVDLLCERQRKLAILVPVSMVNEDEFLISSKSPSGAQEFKAVEPVFDDFFQLGKIVAFDIGGRDKVQGGGEPEACHRHFLPWH